MKGERLLLCLPFVVATIAARLVSRWARQSAVVAPAPAMATDEARSSTPAPPVADHVDVRNLARTLGVLQAAAREPAREEPFVVWVFDPTAAPIRGVKVTALLDRSRSSVVTAGSDDEGRAVLSLAAGERHVLVATAPRMRPWTVALEEDAAREITAVMEMIPPEPADPIFGQLGVPNDESSGL